VAFYLYQGGAMSKILSEAEYNDIERMALDIATGHLREAGGAALMDNSKIRDAIKLGISSGIQAMTRRGR
jgi:Tfp pilus assembly protein PilW